MMNFIYLSPHFPSNYYLFCVSLNVLGVNVLGLADESYDRIRPELRSAIREYYRVENMHSYDQLLRACGYFTHRYGKIDGIDSHNEYWLEIEAHLRTDFNIAGPKLAEMEHFKRKSKMKKLFIRAGIDVPRGGLVKSIREAEKLIDETGYPVVLKPDIGVGAAQTYKLENRDHLVDFFEHKPPGDYLLEEFVSGAIYTFDGLTDQAGKPVFYTSHAYDRGVMEAVNEDALFFYHSLTTIPEDLERAGLNVVKAFGIRQRFFHFEFFRESGTGRLLALEANIRPPGGLTTDMFNYANDIDIYREWANVIVHNRFSASYSRRYFCGYISRKFNRNYKYSHDQIMAEFGERILHHEAISGVFSAALGNYGYIVRSKELAELASIAEFIHTIS
jgi:biotin carboxylase